jgi:hypothetical protein
LYFYIKKNKSIQTILTLIQNITLKRRDIIFGYINIDTDYQLIEYFHIKKNINYKDSIRIEYIIDLLDQNKLNWKSGYFIEDFLYTFGINIDRNILYFFSYYQYF